MKSNKIKIIIGSVILVLISLAIVLPITLLSLNKEKEDSFIFEDKTVIYDGNIHYLEIEADLQKYQITYENNGHKDVGEYEVIAHIQSKKKVYPDMKATLKIIPASLQGIEFKDLTVSYDGNPHSIFITGELPEDVLVSYENNGQINAGVYEVTAHFASIGNNYEIVESLTAILTINRIPLNLDSIEFKDETFTYDGTVKSIEITSNLPEGICVSYTNNNQKDAGSYEVVASFTDSLGNYIISGTKSATLTIEKATYDMSLVQFISKEIPYDGLMHELLIQGILPEGVTVSRYVDNKRAEIGSIMCRVEFVGDEKNYYPIPSMTAQLTIVPGEMTFLQQTEFKEVYTGEALSLDYGKLPEGIHVVYENNLFVDAGSYEVIAHFHDEYGRYVDKTMTLTFIILKKTYDVSNLTFEDKVVIYDGNMHSLHIEGELPEGVVVSYSLSSATEIGSYEVVASFTIPDPKNYNPIPGKVAYLSIVPEQLTGVYLEDQSFSYDGNYHSLVLKGELPLGVTYEFINNDQVEVGVYEVTLQFNVKEYGVLKAILTITKADIHMNNVFFHGATFVYDGLMHELLIEGTLPSMLRVSYQSNRRTEVGRQTAIAIFELLDEKHYNPVENMYAELIIIDNELTGIFFQDKTVVYNQLEHSIFIDGELPEGILVSYTNNGQINAGVYEVIAHFEDTTGKFQNLGDMVAKLTILKANFAKNGIIFVDKEVTYDGNVHRIDIYCDDIPSDILVVYENNDQVNAGVYQIKVSFRDELGNYNPIEPMTATLTIHKATINMDHIRFENKEYEYDGFEHTLTIEGELPKGVRVSYTPNSLTKLGRILVTATFIVDEMNYEAIPPKSAYLTITKGSIENITLESKTYVYDGEVHSLAIEGELPEGVYIKYHNNDQIDAGVYEVNVDFYDDEGYYNSLTAYLTIQKAIYDMSGISFEDEIHVYDGMAHTLLIEGELPEGVTVIYSNNTMVNAGILKVTARFIGNPNYEDIPSMEAILTIEKKAIQGIVFEGETFTYDGLSHSLSVQGIEDYPVRVLYYNNGKIDAGDYEVIVSFVLLNDNYQELQDMKAILSILPIPIGEITFLDQSFILDGNLHYLSISTSLPEGVYAVYENNGQMYEGTYEVTMHLESQNSNYIFPEPLKAYLTIYSDGSYHTVIFHLDENTSDIRIVKNNEGIEEIPIPTKKLGYDGFFEGDFTCITSKMDFYPTYKESLFTIYFDVESVDSIEVLYLSDYTLPTPTKDDYVFKKWVDDAGNEVTAGTYQWTDNLSLYAVWQCKVIIQNTNDYIYEELYLDSDEYLKPTYPFSSYLEGFYLDQELSIPFDMNRPIQINQRLYTKYVYDFDFVINDLDEVHVTGLLDSTKEFYNLETPIYDLYPIKEISAGIFSGCSNVKEIHLPCLEGDFGVLFGEEAYENSMPVLQRQGTFYFPKELGTIKVSSKTIPTFAFLNCSFIHKLILEDVEEVEGFAFQDCVGLNEVHLKNCLKIDEGAFKGCTNLNRIYSDSLEDWIKISFEDEYSTPMASHREFYVNDTYIQDLDLSQTQRIGNYQFYGFTQIKEVHLNEASFLGQASFMGCSGINKLYLSHFLEVSSMDSFAGISALNTIYYDGTLEDWSRIQFQNQYATPMISSPDFYVKKEDTYELVRQINLDSNVNSLGDYQFFGFKNIEEIYLAQVETIGYKALSGLGEVDQFIMPESLTFSATDAFSNTIILNTKYQGSLDQWVNILFSSANSTPLWSNRGKITFDAFVMNLDTIVISSKIESINAYQFFGFKDTKSVEISSAINSIGQNAFGNCTSLESFTFKSSANTILMDNAFLGCESLQNVYYMGTLLEYMDISYKNPEASPLHYGALLWIEGKLVEELTITKDVEDYQFYGLSSLKTVSFMPTVQKIGKYAFASCSSLEELNGLETMISIADSAFEGGSSLLQIRLPNIEVIPASCFRNCSSLEAIDIPKVTKIGSYAFSGCTALSAIDLTNVEEIKNSAFYGCRSLKSISLGKITKLEASTFANCYGLEEVSLPETLTHIAYFAFLGCSRLESIVLPSRVEIIEANAFSEASNLVIYALASSQPTTWRTGWDKGIKSVYWYSMTYQLGNYWHYDSNNHCVPWE